jgi:hypothetical protein
VTRIGSPLRDRELLELLADEPELLAIADAIATTTPPCGAATGRPRPRLRAIAALGVCATAAVLLVLLWPVSSSTSVLDSALAAIGSGTVTHVVVEDDIGSVVLDVKSGRQIPASGRLRIWYAPKHGLLVRSSFLGIDEGGFFVPVQTAFLNRGQPGIAQLVVSYRSSLRAHRFHVVGSGTYRGTPVYWIKGAPVLVGRTPTHTLVEQVGISKATYKPLLYEEFVDGKVTSVQRVLSIETSESGPSALYGTGAIPFGSFSSNVGFFNGVLQYQPLKPKQAKAMRPAPVIPRRIGGLRLSFVGRSPYTSGPGFLDAIPGVLVYYGQVNNSGLPNDTQPGYTGRWVQIVEFPHSNAVVRSFRGHFRADGRAVIDGLAGGVLPEFARAGIAPQFGAPGSVLTAHSATLMTHHRYFLVDAATKSDAITAARTIARLAPH